MRSDAVALRKTDIIERSSRKFAQSTIMRVTMSHHLEDTEKVERKSRQRPVVNEDAERAVRRANAIERAKEISYPIQPDSRGDARMSYDGKVYYFGVWDSPQSYAVFALWKAELIKTGEAPECRQVRPLAKAALDGQPYQPPHVLSRVWFVAALAGGLLAIAIACFGGFLLYSSTKPTEVDGVPLSEFEIGSIRGFRMHAQRVRASRDVPSGVADDLDRIYESMESENGLQPLHDYRRKNTTP